jgi:hypothetical protein
VDTVGEVTATGSGSAWIHAVADQLEDSAYIDVNPPDLSVTPNSISASAAEGSATTHTQYVRIENAGSGSPTWTATTNGSSWLVLSKTSGDVSGGMPDSTLVTLTPRPSGVPLAQDTYHDTLVIALPGASGSPAKVPVEYVIEPCVETPRTPDIIINDSLTTRDCGAPHRGGSFAKLYSFTAGSGNAITLYMDGDFDAYLFLLDGSGNILTQNDECPGNVVRGRACIEDYALPAGSIKIEATSFDADAVGDFVIHAIIITAPDAPQDLEQRTTGGTPIPVGTATDESTVILEARVSDPDPLDTLSLEVEVKPAAADFDGTGTDTSSVAVISGQTAAATVSGLQDNTAYHWRARALDRWDRQGPWVSFGGNPEAAPDFAVDLAPEDPDAPSGLGQFKSDGTTVIGVGAKTNETTVVFKATVSDPDPLDALRLEVEVKPAGVAFDETGTDTSAAVANNSTATVSVPSLSDNTAYRWRVRTLDQDGRSSAWVLFGNDPDFIVDVTAEDPGLPTNPGQFRADATTQIAVGGTTNEVVVVFKAQLTDPDPGDTLWIQIELKAVDAPFDELNLDSDYPTPAAGVSDGSTAQLVVPVSIGTQYHWRARAIDQTGRTSGWVPFGGNFDNPNPPPPDSDIDFERQ